MHNNEQVSQYFVPASLTRRLNAWLTIQGYDWARDEPEVEGGDLPQTYRAKVSEILSGDDADMTFREASRQLYVSESTVRHWVDSGRIRHREVRRIPVSDVERLLEERGGPPE
jgi:excisionase family DNA binding protein